MIILTVKIGLLIAALALQTLPVQASEINRNLEASTLKNGYAIRILKPLPRRNSGCDTIFRSGKVLDSCEPNYGVDPAIEGVVRNYCEWNLNTHYQKHNPAKWLESYDHAKLISIANARVGFVQQDEYQTLFHRFQKKEYITYRWIELEFNDQISGSKLGTLKCYPSQVYEYDPRREYLYGNYFYHFDESYEVNSQKIKSGVTIGMILDQLKGYVEIVKLK